jgi:hypothetical protein
VDLGMLEKTLEIFLRHPWSQEGSATLEP